MSDLIGAHPKISLFSKDVDSLLDEFDLPSSSIDDHLFDIPALTSLPSLESILHEQDPTFDDTSLASSTLNPPDDKPTNYLNNLYSSQPSSASFDSLLDNQTQPVDNYILKLHHHQQQQDTSSIDESYLEIPKHKQLTHGSLLKILPLQTISNQLALCIERTHYGQPTTIDILLHRFIAIGTTQSVVLLFEHQTEILKHCLNSDLSNGAVSALNFNSDGKRLLVGYACGRIQMYDCTNGKLLRNISNDIHATDTAILNIKFTHDPTMALFSDSGGSVYVLQFTRHLKRGYQSKCLFSGSRGEVCTIEPLLFSHHQDLLTTDTNERLEQHPLKSMYLVALATFTKVFILALKSANDVKILHVQRLVGSKATLPILKWQFIIVKVSEEINCITPIFVAVRDKQCTFFQIQHVRDDEIRISQLKQITVDYHIKSFAWLNARTFILFDMSERAHVIDQRSGEQLECLSLSYCELIYNTIFFKSLATGGNVSSALAEAGQNACYQTFLSNQGCVFLLGIHTLYEIHLRDWSERIDFYIENNKNQYEQALELAYSMLVGKAKGLTGLPIDPIKRRQCISDRMVSLLQSYLKYTLNYECPQSGTIDLLKQHYRHILPRSIDYCLLIDRLDLLFGLIYDLFCNDAVAHGIYLQSLESYILANRFDTISPIVLKDFIDYYVENNSLHQLEQCLNRLDVSCLDLDQVIHITRKYDLYMTLLHVYSEAFKDFTTILKEILEKLEDDVAQNNGTGYSTKMIAIGNQALVFIQTILVGDIYPYGGRLSSDLAQFGRNQIVDFLSYLHPRRTGGLLYTNLRILLHFNTRDFFNLLTMAFDNEEFLHDVEILKRRAFCDILLRVMVDDVQFSSHQISILFHFLSRQLAKVGQQHIFVQGMLFEQVLEYLCKSVLTSANNTDDSKDERERALLDVIQAAGLQAFDLPRLLTLAQQAQFWRVCEIIYSQNNEYDLVLECYLHTTQRRVDLFRYIRTIWPSLDEQQRTKIQNKIFEHFTEIIEADALKAYKLFCIFFQMDLGKVLKLINKNEPAQYSILKSCFTYADETKSTSPSPSDIQIDPSHYLHYIDLLARYDPSQLLSFLKVKSENYREQEVLEIIRKYPSPLLISSIAYLLERLGQYSETFDLLLESMHQWQTIEQLYPMALDCVHFCQRTTGKLKNKKEREDLWLKFLQTILEISSNSFDHEQAGAFRRIYGEILNSMIGYVTLPSILELIMGTDVVDSIEGTKRRAETNTRTTFEIRQLIQSMLENCTFELRLLETTRRLLQRDLNDDIEQMCTIMNRSVPIRMNQCTYCQRSLLHQQQQDLDNKQQQNHKFIVFACRHVFHLRCLWDIQSEPSNNKFCPQCTTQSSSPATTTTATTTVTPLVRPELRRLTSIHNDQNEKQMALNNVQQQVITAILDRKRLNAHHWNTDDHDEQIPTSIGRSNVSLPLPDKWREYLSPSE